MTEPPLPTLRIWRPWWVPIVILFLVLFAMGGLLALAGVTVGIVILPLMIYLSDSEFWPFLGRLLFVLGYVLVFPLYGLPRRPVYLATAAVLCVIAGAAASITELDQYFGLLMLGSFGHLLGVAAMAALRTVDQYSDSRYWIAAALGQGRCPGCRYDIRQLSTPRCPECGLDLTPPDDLPPEWSRGD